jgi:hypothetical protein
MPAPSDLAASIGQQFPGWTFWLSGTGRWWACPKGELSTADRAAGCVLLLHAYEPEALAGQIRAREHAAARALTGPTPPRLGRSAGYARRETASGRRAAPPASDPAP